MRAATAPTNTHDADFESNAAPPFVFVGLLAASVAAPVPVPVAVLVPEAV